LVLLQEILTISDERIWKTLKITENIGFLMLNLNKIANCIKQPFLLPKIVNNVASKCE